MGSSIWGRIDRMGFQLTDGFWDHPVAIGLCKVFGKMNGGGRGNWLRRESSKGTSSRCFK